MFIGGRGQGSPGYFQMSEISEIQTLHSSAWKVGRKRERERERDGAAL